MNIDTGLSAVQLRRFIGARLLSPLELLDACIARIGRLNPAVNALAATDFERARDAARAAGAAVMRGDALGPLHGLPIGIKDLQDTAGLLTTSGNVGRRNHVPDTDDAMVARLRAAGAIVTAKTNVPDMGAGANTRNPHGAQPAIRSIRRSMQAARPAGRQWHWRWTCCRCAPVPTPAGHCGYRRRSAVWSACGHRPA